jgi:hypothetical protein
MNRSAASSLRCFCIFAIDSSSDFQKSGGYDSSFFYLNELLSNLRDPRIGVKDSVRLQFGLAVGDRAHLVNNAWFTKPPVGYDSNRYRQKTENLNYGVRSAITTAANQLVLLNDVELPDLVICTVFSGEKPATDCLDGLRRLKSTPLYGKAKWSIQWVPQPAGNLFDKEKLRGVASFLQKDINDFHDLSSPDKFYAYLCAYTSESKSSRTNQ